MFNIFSIELGISFTLYQIPDHKILTISQFYFERKLDLTSQLHNTFYFCSFESFD